MPELSDPELVGRFAFGYVKNVLETGWRVIVQPFEGPNDRGLDATVLDHHRGKPTPDQFNIQVKTVRLGARGADTFRAPVERRHVDMWRALNVPVVLICVDPGPPSLAYWALLDPRSSEWPIRVNRRQVFGPASRDAVVAAVRVAVPRTPPPAAVGEMLAVPLGCGVRDVAKVYYFAELRPRPHENPSFGPVEFTWKGWRHLTRRGRSAATVAASLLLLPCIRHVLDASFRPAVGWRPLPSRTFGGYECRRTLLAFDRVVHLRHRAPAHIRVVVECEHSIPEDWFRSEPSDRRRTLKYRFLSVYEVSAPAPP